MATLHYKGLTVYGWANRQHGTRLDSPYWDIGIECISILDWDNFSSYGLLDSLGISKGTQDILGRYHTSFPILPSLEKAILAYWEDDILAALANSQL